MNESASILDKILSMGEEAQGQLLAKLLSSDRVVSLLNIAINSGGVARAAVESGMLSLFKAFNVPSLDDVQELERKLDDLEELVTEIARLIPQLAHSSAHAESAHTEAKSAVKKRRSRRRD